MSIVSSVEDFEKYKLNVISHNGSTLQFLSVANSTVELCQTWKRKRHLGGGSYGQVWQEVWEDDHGDAHYRAVKTCSEVTMRASSIDYKRELAALAAFSRSECSGWFVGFHGWWMESENLCLATEYLHLGDLSGYATSEIPEAELKEVAEDILQGLDVMHREGFVHRDIKPQNILVHKKRPEFYRWWVKIADFGMSKRVHADAGTALRTIAGTRSYCAPEIFENLDQPEKTFVYSNKVDLWSFGCVLFNLASRGQLPFLGRELTRYCDGRVQFNSRNVPIYMSDTGVSLVKALLSVDSQQRPTAAEALRHLWFTTSNLKEADLAFKAPIESQSTYRENFNSFLNSMSSGDTPKHQRQAELTTRPKMAVARETATGSTSIVPQASASEQDHKGQDREHLDRSRDLAYRMNGEAGKTESPSLGNKPSLPNNEPDESTVRQRRSSSNKRAWNLNDLRSATQKISQALVPDLNMWLAANQNQIGERWEGWPILLAAYQGRLSILVQLVQQGADIHVKTSDGMTPLHFAAGDGHRQVVTWLVEAGADIRVKDNEGMTPLHCAALGGHREVVIWLAEAGADIHVKSGDGSIPLHFAAMGGHREVVMWLAEAGADIHAKNNEGMTPLHFAALGGHREVVIWLVEAGADVHAKNEDGSTPLSFATHGGYSEVVAWLKQHGAAKPRSKQSSLAAGPSRHEQQPTSTRSILRKMFSTK